MPEWSTASCAIKLSRLLTLPEITAALTPCAAARFFCAASLLPALVVDVPVLVLQEMQYAITASAKRVHMLRFWLREN